MKNRSITSATLHVLAMALMVCDHVAGTVLPGCAWLHTVGRLAFPLFAFLLVEGYCHTRDFRRYWLRLLVFALISEVPFDLMAYGVLFYPFHQNVLWTFLIALGLLRLLELAKYQTRRWGTLLMGVLAVSLAYVLGYLFMVDYFGEGVQMVLLFYIFRGSRWWQRLGQLAGLWYLNRALGGYGYELALLGQNVFLPRQLLAVLALPILWCYRGRQGHHSKAFRWFCYAFYPGHMILLWLGMYL